jgi:hydroxyacyl-ACP dehydratase HTD2-like protein with hotdog domain
MADQTYFEDVSVGDAVPALSVTVDETQMFFFSAATYNGHRIHYDKTWATEVEGYQNILVQGPLQAALLARAVTDWAGPDGRLVSYAIQNRASAFPGEELRFAGTVTGKREGRATPDDSGRGLVDLEIRGEKGDSAVLMPGTATVSLPKRG